MSGAHQHAEQQYPHKPSQHTAVLKDGMWQHKGPRICKPGLHCVIAKSIRLIDIQRRHGLPLIRAYSIRQRNAGLAQASRCRSNRNADSLARHDELDPSILLSPRGVVVGRHWKAVA